MAKKKIITALIVFTCLIAVSTAAAETEESEFPVRVPESKSESVIDEFIALPVDSDHKKPNSRSPFPVPQESDSKSTVPLKKSTFRPVNRRFPGKGKHHAWRETAPELLIASGENGDFVKAPIPRGNMQRDVKIKKHHRPRYHHDDSDGDDEDEMEKMMSHRRKYHHHVHGKRSVDQKHQNTEEMKQQDGDFMGTVRMFLNKYF